MKKYKDIGIYDFSDYAEEITGDVLFKINGGAEIENSIEAQANARASALYISTDFFKAIFAFITKHLFS